MQGPKTLPTTGPGVMAYDYFDEDYFQNGASKGTVYNNYLEVSRSSLIYREIAEAVARVFRPRRALEIGCATGVIVRYLNEMGVETHGIDVSEWAVSKREHPHVVLAGVEKLPFPDGHFDFIYSVHALEHIPQPLKSAAFEELRRVCGRGTQFHMMPIVGLGPYVGERDAVIAGLQKDPTHSLLDDRIWWLAEFKQIGFADVHAGLHFANEAGAIDLSEKSGARRRSPAGRRTSRPHPDLERQCAAVCGPPSEARGARYLCAARRWSSSACTGVAADGTVG